MDYIIKVKPTLFITDKQFEILAHRLEVPCAIAESLNGDFGYPICETCSVVNELYNKLKNECRLIDLDTLTKLQKRILENCIEASTLLDMMEDEVGGDITQEELNNTRRVFYTLRNKMIRVGIFLA